MNNKNLMLILSVFAVCSGVFLSKLSSFFGFLFMLVYIGAILVLMIYVFSLNISMNSIIYWIFFVVVGGGCIVFILNFNSHILSCDLKFFLYNSVELFLVFFLCKFILMMLFCLLKLDYFRFSSLRSGS